MADNGWIKLYRKTMNSFVWTDANQLKLWLLILMKANHSKNRFLFNGQEVAVSSGQFVTGAHALAFEYNDGVPSDKAIAQRTLWRWLKKFEKEQMLTIKSTTKYSVITVINYSSYQLGDKPVTNEWQASDKRVTTNKNDKNDKNEKNNIYSSVISYLNEKADTHFKPSSKATQRFIDARVNDKFELDDFKKVIDTKVAGWKGTDWEKFLRPATLFGPKFEDYLNEKNVKPHSTYRNSPGKQEIATDWSKKTVEVDPSITDEYLDSLLDSIDKDTSKEEKDEKIF